MRRPVLLASTAAVTCALAACGAGAREADAAASATRFASAVEQGDGEAACGLLSPAARKAAEDRAVSCPGAVTELPTAPVGEPAVEVWGDEALVRLEGDTVFLHRYDEGWRVTAAGCVSEESAPYDCDLEG